MKVLKVILPLFIAISLLAISVGISEGSPFSSSSVGLTSSTIAVQTELPSPISTDVHKEWVDGGLVAENNLSQPEPAVISELPIPNDPYIDRQWALNQIRMPELWQITTGSPEILVAVLDTGIDQSHVDLEGKVVAEINLTGSPTPSDIHGHGTHVAGIIAASSNNGIGIAGVAPQCRLMNVKVADDRGKCQATALAEGIIWAVDNGASVINISVEIKEPSPELVDAVDYAWNKGVIIIAAAGNEGNDSPIYPAYYENSLAVASIKENDTFAPLSNYGEWVDVAAPGFKIYSTLPDDSYDYKTGTSFATPYVSGLAALLFNVVTDTNGDGWLNDEVRAAIEAGCQEIGIDGVGSGQIDAANSLAKAGYTS